MVTKRLLLTATSAAVLALLAGCSVHNTQTPSLTGPSGLGTNIAITVSPDVLVRDGASQSQVTVTATNTTGQPMPNLSLRLAVVDPESNQVTNALGTLSAINVVTSGSGQATAVFTAPAPIQGGTTSTTVEIAATPLGTDFGNEQMRVAQIQLVPQGVIGAPPSSLKPDFAAPSPNVGDAAVFSATVVDSSGNSAINQVASFSWNFGDGGTATGQSATHTFSSPGNFSVTLTIKDQQGNTAFATHGVTVAQGQLPVPNFVMSPLSPAIDQVINFNATSSTAAPGHNIVGFAWDFGDGTSGSGALTTHMYSQAGTYTIVLQVTDDAGRQATTQQTVSVGTGIPTAAFSFAPSSPTTNQVVSFDASASQPTPGRSIVSYTWTFDDGATAGGVQATHSYASAGTYNVLLTVTDSAGQKSSVTHGVPVVNGNPTATFTFSPTTPIFAQNVFFDGTQSQAKAGRTITNYAWAWGDGTANGTGATPTHPFPAAGTYIVKLTVTDSAGLTGSTTQSIVVGNGDPIASFIVNPSSPTHGSPAVFDGSSSTAASGRTITSYAWTFGDGSSSSGPSATTSHTYAAAGTFSVTLTVTDSAGRTSSTTLNITVS